MDRTQRGGRNDRCPKCGAKNKHCECIPSDATRKRNFYGIAACALVLIGLIIMLRPKAPGAMSSRPNTSNYNRTIDQYLAGHIKKPDGWWLINSQPPSRELDRVIKQTKVEAEVVKQAIERYRSTSPLTQEIAKAFPKFHFSLTIGGSSVTLAHHKDELSIDPITGLEIAFIPMMEKDFHPSRLYYDAKIKRLALAGITWPEKVLPGFLYHELGHGWYDQQGKPSATAPPDSELFAQEEVEMHELQNEVFNKASDGAYAKTLDALLDARKPDNWQDAALGITPAEMQRLDDVLGCRDAGEVVANMMGGQYSFALGTRYITRDTMTPEVKTAWKTQLYRFLREQSQR